jgi:hypothetical protein
MLLWRLRDKRPRECRTTDECYELAPLHAHLPGTTYYQELMPTIQQAGRLSVRERDKRFGPAITAAFDLATMTRLAVGPAWKDFSAARGPESRRPLRALSWQTMRAR